MYEIAFQGIFETKDQEAFLEAIKESMEKTNTSFRGKVLRFLVDDYVDYEEIINEETSD